MSEKKCSLGIDLGTGSCKMCLLNRKGEIAGRSSSGYSTHSEAPGWAAQNSADWLDAVRKAAEDLFRGSGIDKRDIEIIVLTSAAHIGVLSGEKGKPLTESLLWSDQRSAEEVDYLNDLMGEKIIEAVDNRVSTTWTLPHLLWHRKNNRGAFNKIKKVFLSKDFLLYHLTGKCITDPATAISSMLCDSKTMSWSPELCEIAGIRESMLPEIAGAGDIAGNLNTDGAELLNLPEGIPVINGSLDSAVETYGAGALRTGEYVIRIGTAGGIHRIRSERGTCPDHLNYPYIIDGLWYSQAGTNSAGSSLAWAIRSAGLSDSNEDYLYFNSLASEAEPGSSGLLFHPYLSGERTPYWNSELRGTFSGISFLHTKAHFARAVLEGVAFSLYDALLSLASRSELPEEISVVGRGAENPVLMDVLSSLLNRKLAVKKAVDSAFGAALFGLHCIGKDKIFSVKSVPGEQIFVPVKQLAYEYLKLFGVYKNNAQHLIMMYDKSNDAGQQKKI